jgi:cytosine/adenosine deaminase-related metal-dependent hydrolase
MSERREKYEEGIDILINNDKIEKIEKNITEAECEKVIDATGKVVMPGFINTHAHVPMSIFRDTLDGYGLQEWLNDKIWPMEDKLTRDDIYYASYLSFVEMIETGCTTINDMYFMTEEIIKAMEETGVRLQTTRTLMSAGGDASSEERLNEFINLLQNYKNKDSKEPLFHFSTKGAYDIDLTKVAVCTVAAFVALSTVKVAMKLKKAKKNKLKRLKEQLKEEKKALREAKKA